MCCPCFVVLRKDDAVTIFNISADCDRMPSQAHIQHTLNAGIEIVHVTMKNTTIHGTHPFKKHEQLF